MSEKTIRAEIITLYMTDTNNLKESEDILDPRSNVKVEEIIREVVTYIPNAKIVDIINIVNPDKTIITKELLSTNNKTDIIFIIGDVDFTERQCANEAIESVTVDRKELSTELTNLMTNIEKKLEEIMRHRTRCGIRNKTLFINLSGTHEDRETCIAAISDILINAMHLVLGKRETQHFSLSDIASSASASRDNDFPEQNMNNNPNNCHKELFPTIPLEDALEILNKIAQAKMDKINHESVKIKDAYGRILCEDVHPNCSVPPFRTSSKHGYAVSVKDGKELRRVQEGENGFPPLPLQPGTCVWVNSGEPIPEGATAVVQVKDTKPLEGSPNDDSKYIEIMIKHLDVYKQTRCGIRNKTLFINLSGTHEDREKCMAAISDILMNAMHLVGKRETQHFSLSDIASSASRDNDFPEQNMNNNPNNFHKELFPTIPLEDALKILNKVAQAGMDKINHESVKIKDAYGRILCEDVHPNCPVPPFRTSCKHGYAVSVKDGKGLRRVQEGENGFPPLPLQPGTCVWVNSGEPIPEGATAVVQVKDTKPLEGTPNGDSKYIEIMIKPQHGQNIKPIGFDICDRKKDIILKKFTRIGPEEIGVLAASGCKEVIVAKRLSIGVLSIGDNLQEPGEPLQPGFTYDINRITLISLLKHNGYSSLDFGIVNDK
ncbi:Gephyrin, partial [Temnothorax longispinosus]